MQSSTGSSSDYVVRLAKPHEHRAAALLVPQAFEDFIAPVVFVATVGTPPQVVGALGMIPRAAGSVPGFMVMVRVAKPYRQRGMARALMALAETEARARGIKALYVPDILEIDSSEAQAWAALGFRDAVHINHYEVPTVNMLQLTTPLWEELRNHNWIPPAAHLVGMRDVPAEQLAKMHVTQLGGRYQWVLRRLKGIAPQSYEPALSHVLLVGKELAGMAVARTEAPDVAFVEGIIVAPEFRMGWCHLMLKHHGIRVAHELGRHTMRFTAHDQHKDTRKMAKRSGAILIAEKVLPYRKL